MVSKQKKKRVARVKPAAALSARPDVKSAAKAISDAASGSNIFAGAFPQFQSLTAETTMIKNTKQFEKMSQDAGMLGQGSMDAMSRSVSIFTKGMEDMRNMYMEMIQDSVQKSQAAAKSLMACKTLNEFTDVQTRLAQASFDECMTNATRLSEKSVKLCSEAFAPMNDQMGRSMKKATDNMAA